MSAEEAVFPCVPGRIAVSTANTYRRCPRVAQTASQRDPISSKSTCTFPPVIGPLGTDFGTRWEQGQKSMWEFAPD